MQGEYKKRLDELAKKIDTMSDEELRHFVAELYFSVQGMPVLMDFLIRKGIIDRDELREYCEKKLREADEGT